MAKKLATRFSIHETYGPLWKKAMLLFVGFCIGTGFGLIFMGATHAIMEIGSTSHYGQEKSYANRKIDIDELPFTDSEAATALDQHQQLEVGNDVHHASVDSNNSGQEEYVPIKIGPISVSAEAPQNSVHVLITSGGGPYQDYQTRIVYQTFLKAQEMPGNTMVAFTRILHRTSDDALMSEVPTFRAQPLQPNCDVWCNYPVSDRPNAIAQFFAAAADTPSMIQAPWVYMGEADYVFVKPLEVPGAANDRSIKSVGFSFGYIAPTWPSVVPIMKKYYDGHPSDIPSTGPAPGLFRIDEWVKLLPTWERLTAQFESDEETKKDLDWVREMYSFSLALAIEKIDVDLQEPPDSKTIIQPPADHTLGQASQLHYTWGPEFHEGSKDGPLIWKFDKRDFIQEDVAVEMPLIPEPPSFEEGWVLQDDIPVTQDLVETLTLMIQTMNEGIRHIKPDATYKKYDQK